jgi:heme exporter protein D
MGGDASPWWLALAIAIVAGLVAAIGKLWTEIAALRREADARSEREQATADARSERQQGEHRRDLRRMVWGPSDAPKGGKGGKEP